jgi:diguanylate cyclase (GGDEF)-like protein
MSLCIARLVAIWLLSLAWLTTTVADSAAQASPSVHVEPQFRPTVRAFTNRDGLPQNAVTSMARMSSGALWLGTYGGLTKFDGVTFTVVRSLANSGPGSDRITGLIADGEDQLWIATEDAGVTVMHDGVFERLEFCGRKCLVAGLFATKQYVFALSSVGLFAIHKQTHVASLASHEAFQFGVATSANDIYVMTNGKIFAMTEPAQLPLGEWPMQPIAAPQPAHEIGRPFIINDELWFAANNVYRYANGTWSTPYPGMLDKHIYLILRDAANQVWMIDWEGNIYIDKGNQTFETNAVSDTVRIVSALVTDDATVWLGSASKGLFRLRPSNIGLLNQPGSNFNFPGFAVASSSNGDMWFGINCKGLRKVDKDGAVTAWPMLGEMDTGCPWSLHVDHQQKVWIGSSDGRVGYVETDSAGVQNIRLFYTWLDRRMVRSIFKQGDQLWVAAGTQTFVFELNSGSGKQEPKLIAAAGEASLTRIRPAKKGGLWLIGDQGVSRWHQDKVVEHWGPEQGLSSRFARTVFEDDQGGLWIGTYGGGLNVIRNGAVHIYNEEHGLAEDVVSCLLQDRQGRLWAGGNRGITSISEAQQRSAGVDKRIEVEHYSNEDGLNPEETNGGTDPACTQDSQGRLWFSMLSGFAVVDPSHGVVAASAAPTPSIEQVRLSGQIVGNQGSLTIDDSVDNVEIRYTAAILSRPEKARFRYRLTDEEWTDAGARRVMFGSHLPWGSYDFEVQVRIADGPWSQSARLKIEHPKPWHRKPYVWALLALALVILTLLAQRLIQRLLQQSTARAMQPIISKTEQLQRDNKELDLQAKQDVLTGVANRRRFDEELATAWTNRQHIPFAVLMIDIDEFKKYNDHFGHIQGDQCLRSVATAMQACIAEPSLLARYGGEEFSVIIVHCTSNQEIDIAQQLVTTVAALQLPHAPAARHRHVTISVGAVVASNEATSDELLSRADRALYRAKQGGRNRSLKASISPDG